MPLKGVILAGGSGTRLFPLTLVTNKHLLPVYDRPMIFYPFHPSDMGVRETMVVVGGRSVGDVLELLHDGTDFGLDLSYRYQRGALGIAHATGPGAAFCGRRSDRRHPGRQHRPRLPAIDRRGLRGRRSRGAAILKRVPDPERFGVAEFDQNGRVVGFEEKPKQPKSDLIPIGIYFFRPSVFDILSELEPSGRGEFEITDVLNTFIERGSFATYEFDGEWQDAGTIESLLRAASLPPASPQRCPAGPRSGRRPWRPSTWIRERCALSRPRRLLVTGGAGFIGSTFVRHMLARDPELHVVVLDKLTYAGNLANLEEVAQDPASRSSTATSRRPSVNDLAAEPTPSSTSPPSRTSIAASRPEPSSTEVNGT